jgi:hypothetical protein
MTKLDQLPPPVVGCGASLHADETGGLLLEEGKNLTASQLTANHSLSHFINTVDLENVFREIKSDCDSFLHGRLLFSRG